MGLGVQSELSPTRQEKKERIYLSEKKAKADSQGAQGKDNFYKGNARRRWDRRRGACVARRKGKSGHSHARKGKCSCGGRVKRRKIVRGRENSVQGERIGRSTAQIRGIGRQQKPGLRRKLRTGEKKKNRSAGGKSFKAM